ncbi:MAG: HEPN domain-containing protein [Candidatus Hydrogenedentes bacterium]|nr:HEPN domain-containing protein [Candidatus Hydrogenedentota bacterium]
MNGEADEWLCYAAENLRTCQLCLEDGLYNASLQNAQQATEKALKATALLFGLPPRKTHSIQDLVRELEITGVEPMLTDGECALLDSIYLPSKYPLGSVLPNYDPNLEIAMQCLSIAEKCVLDARRRRNHGAC